MTPGAAARTRSATAVSRLKGNGELASGFVLISGCSGGGKSTLLEALAARKHAVVAEPGRRIVKEEIRGSGTALPWVNMKAFAQRTLAMARSDLAAARSEKGIVFFDRGLVDAAVGLQFAGGEPYHQTLGDRRHYWRTVFLAPPWPEIFVQDEERRHDFKAASEEFDRLKFALIELGYNPCVLPKATVNDRIQFVLERLPHQCFPNDRLDSINFRT